MLTSATTKTINYYNAFSNFISDLRVKPASQSDYLRTNNYYQEVLTQYTKSESYINLYNEADKQPVLRTDTEIKPDLLGADMDTVIRKKGRADFVFTENDITIFVYRRKINGLKSRSKVHFYKGKVFLINNYYLCLSSVDKKYISKALGEKYDVPANQLAQCTITDNNNNHIFINNAVAGLMINYMSDKITGWYDGLQASINAEQTKQIKTNTRRSKQFFASL